MIEFLLLDLDDTILDFHKAESVALGKTLQSFGVEPTEDARARYSQINQRHWEMLERREITREQVLLGRFEVFFREFGIQVDAAVCARAYSENLSQGHFFLPGALKTLHALHENYRLFLVSNGTAWVQERRLDSAGIVPLFEEIFISQNVGHNKPAREFFDHCFAHISGFERERAIIVGDSLSSDILGGIRAGIRTCWVNPKGKSPGDIRPDHEIQTIAQLPQLLESLKA